jgi:hypothetical protein
MGGDSRVTPNAFPICSASFVAYLPGCSPRCSRLTRDYQIFTLASSARYIRSPGFTLNAS